MHARWLCIFDSYCLHLLVLKVWFIYFIIIQTLELCVLTILISKLLLLKLLLVMHKSIYIAIDEYIILSPALHVITHGSIQLLYREIAGDTRRRPLLYDQPRCTDCGGDRWYCWDEDNWWGFWCTWFYSRGEIVSLQRLLLYFSLYIYWHIHVRAHIQVHVLIQCVCFYIVLDIHVNPCSCVCSEPQTLTDQTILY